MITFLPKSISKIQVLPLIEKIIESILIGLAKIFGFWKYPLIHDPDKLNAINNAYFAYKVDKNVTKGQKGKNLEEYFATHQVKPLKMLPHGFETKSSLSLSSVGDLMNARGSENSKDKFYEKVHDLIFSADVSIANLESTLTRDKIDKTTFTLDEMPKINATPDQYKALKGHQDKQYTIFQLANNHILDCGWQGFETTLDQLEQDGILYYGVNKTQEEQKKALIYETEGFKLGFIQQGGYKKQTWNHP